MNFNESQIETNGLNNATLDLNHKLPRGSLKEVIAVGDAYATKFEKPTVNPFGTMGSYMHPQKVLKMLEFHTSKKEQEN